MTKTECMRFILYVNSLFTAVWVFFFNTCSLRLIALCWLCWFWLASRQCVWTGVCVWFSAHSVISFLIWIAGETFTSKTVKCISFLFWIFCPHNFSCGDSLWVLVQLRTPWFELLVIFDFFAPSSSIEGVKKHYLWKPHVKVQRKSWSNVPPKLLACVGFLPVLIPKTIRNRKRDCAWGCARGKTPPEKICIQYRKAQISPVSGAFLICAFRSADFVRWCLSPERNLTHNLFFYFQ